MKNSVYILIIFGWITISCDSQKVVNMSKDTDLDGLHDDRDACPSESGSVFNQGCPQEKLAVVQLNPDKSTDADLDGVSDEKDECPNEYGSYFNQGCPSIEK